MGFFFLSFSMLDRRSQIINQMKVAHTVQRALVDAATQWDSLSGREVQKKPLNNEDDIAITDNAVKTDNTVKAGPKRRRRRQVKGWFPWFAQRKST